MNVFEKLSKIDVSKHVETVSYTTKKGKRVSLSYLSWAWAWYYLKRECPEATYKIYETSEGMNYFNDGRTGWVKTGVTVDGIEYVEYLPIMDRSNNSIPVDKITSFDVNKTIQRSLTKACARHGLGLYLYAGEDLPEWDEITPEQIKLIHTLANAVGMSEDELHSKIKTQSVKNLNKDEAEKTISWLKKKANEMEVPE